MEYLLQRYQDNGESTLGLFFKKLTKLFLLGYSLEDEYRAEKVKGETRIPAGRYEIVINKADTPLTLKYRQRYPGWFKYHLMLKNVPNFVGIYFHVGKNDDWTDGCITIGNIVNNNNVAAGEILDSARCFEHFYVELYEHLDKGGKAWVEIKDE